MKNGFRIVFVSLMKICFTFYLLNEPGTVIRFSVIARNKRETISWYGPCISFWRLFPYCSMIASLKNELNIIEDNKNEMTLNLRCQRKNDSRLFFFLETKNDVLITGLSVFDWRVQTELKKHEIFRKTKFFNCVELTTKYICRLSLWGKRKARVTWL